MNQRHENELVFPYEIAQILHEIPNENILLLPFLHQLSRFSVRRRFFDEVTYDSETELLRQQYAVSISDYESEKTDVRLSSQPLRYRHQANDYGKILKIIIAIVTSVQIIN